MIKVVFDYHVQYYSYTGVTLFNMSSIKILSFTKYDFITGGFSQERKT